MLTYVLGPILSLLPRPWRQLLSFMRIKWERAAAISGFLEFGIGIAAFMQWYAVTMSYWVNRGLEAAMDGKAGPGITDHAIGGAAWVIWATDPMTWFLGYVILEGAVRLCAAVFSDNALGTLPLFIVGKVLSVFLPRGKNEQETPNVAASFFGAIRDKVAESSLPASADQVIAKQDGIEEFLEIRASRRKPDWDPPRVVRIRDTYYRLESFTKGAPPRPFRYTLRKLTAGVPGRNVLVYQVDEEMISN